jgi:hypothetical protein
MFHLKQFLSWIKDKRYRKHFFNSLNHYRINSIFLLSEIAYAIVADLLLCVIEELILQSDYENFRYCLILSQTYHKDSINSYNNSKVYLQNAIEVNNIFRDINFWEEIIKCKSKSYNRFNQ